MSESIVCDPLSSFHEHQPPRSRLEVVQGRRTAETKWLVIKTRLDGGQEVSTFRSEVEARMAAASGSFAADSDRETRDIDGCETMPYTEFTVRKPGWWV